jgi:hypothetical protein
VRRGHRHLFLLSLVVRPSLRLQAGEEQLAARWLHLAIEQPPADAREEIGRLTEVRTVDRPRVCVIGPEPQIGDVQHRVAVQVDYVKG